MGRNGIDDSVLALEEWCSTYMSTPEHDIDTFLGPLRQESMDFEAFEAEVVKAEKDVAVVDGFCSTCQTMLDYWPDFEPWEFEARLRESDNQADLGLDSHFWLHACPLATAESPCHCDIVSRTAGSTKGCRCCLLIVDSIKDRDAFHDYIGIDRQLRKLGKPSGIHMATCCVDRPVFEYVLFLREAQKLDLNWSLLVSAEGLLFCHPQ